MSQFVKDAARVTTAVVGRAFIVKFGAIAVVIIIAFFGLMMALLPAGSSQAPGVGAIGPKCVPAGISGGGPLATGSILEQQLANAKAIDQAAQKVGMSGAASRIAIITAVGESDLINLDYGDAAGPDSKGLFQQRPSQGWGTIEQVMNPEYAATSFLIGPQRDRKAGLISIPGWEQMDPSAAIHAVQRNADPNHYTRFVNRAEAIIAKAGINIGRAGTDAVNTNLSAGNTGTECGGSGTVTVAGDGKDDYPFKSITPPAGTEVPDPFGYFYGECTSWVAWAFNRDAGSTSAPFKYAGGNFANGNGADWKAAWLARGWPVSNTPQPGAVAWWGSNGGPGIGTYGHVAYVEKVMPDGRVLITEYNYITPTIPGHNFNSRIIEASSVNGFLLPPQK